MRQPSLVRWWVLENLLFSKTSSWHVSRCGQLQHCNHRSAHSTAVHCVHLSRRELTRQWLCGRCSALNPPDASDSSSRSECQAHQHLSESASLLLDEVCKVPILSSTAVSCEPQISDPHCGQCQVEALQLAYTTLNCLGKPGNRHSCCLRMLHKSHVTCKGLLAPAIRISATANRAPAAPIAMPTATPIMTESLWSISSAAGPAFLC